MQLDYVDEFIRDQSLSSREEYNKSSKFKVARPALQLRYYVLAGSESEKYSQKRKWYLTIEQHRAEHYLRL